MSLLSLYEAAPGLTALSLLALLACSGHVLWARARFRRKEYRMVLELRARASSCEELTRRGEEVIRAFERAERGLGEKVERQARELHELYCVLERVEGLGLTAVETSPSFVQHLEPSRGSSRDVAAFAQRVEELHRERVHEIERQSEVIRGLRERLLDLEQQQSSFQQGSAPVSCSFVEPSAPGAQEQEKFPGASSQHEAPEQEITAAALGGRDEEEPLSDPSGGGDWLTFGSFEEVPAGPGADPQDRSTSDPQPVVLSGTADENELLVFGSFEVDGPEGQEEAAASLAGPSESGGTWEDLLSSAFAGEESTASTFRAHVDLAETSYFGPSTSSWRAGEELDSSSVEFTFAAHLDAGSEPGAGLALEEDHSPTRSIDRGRLAGRLARLRRQLESERARAAEIAVRLEQAQHGQHDREEELREQLASSIECLESTLNDRDELARGMVEVQQRVTASEQEVERQASLIGEHGEALGQLEDLRGAASRAEGELVELRDREADLLQRLEQEEETLELLRAREQELEGSVAELGEQLHEARAHLESQRGPVLEMRHQLEAGFASLRMQQDAIHAREHEVEQQLGALQHERGNLEHRRHEVESRLVEHEQDRARIGSLEAELAQVRGELDGRQSELEEAQSRLQQQGQELSEVWRELEQQSERREELEGEVAQRCSEREEARARVGSLESELEQLGSERGQLGQELAELERTSGERQLELEQHLASRAAEYEQLEVRLFEGQEAAAAAEQRLRDELGRLEEELARNGSQREELERVASGLREELEAARADLLERGNSLEEYRTRLQLTEEELGRLEQQLEERTSSLHDREEAMSQLTGELDGFRSREAQRDEQVAQVRQLFERLQPYLGDLERNLMSDFEETAEQAGGGSAVESGGGSADGSAAGSTAEGQ